MDDTTQSRTSDAAATRKRRSSILKSQRPPRTPFCELEFNVCTPTDSAKSRRVSFSKRTGVAEFVTNEATTTWKNFYEEHNKSQESSGNESEANCAKEPISHLGKRIFDQQFEEVEAVDFLSNINISSSINSVNFAQIEHTNTTLTAPQNNFELSTFTEHRSKLFGDDIGITCSGEVTDCIDVNFSSVQQIGEKDDLDEIQKDIQLQRNACPVGMFDRQNLSEYIEVDLNTTHVAIVNEESDMSITDTIHSPKVQDLSKSCSIEKKINASQDWETDKENIAINPYVAPQESLNFAINEEVLIFDGKKLVIQTEKSVNENYRQTPLPNPSEKNPLRKTIVRNCNDDLPNIIEDAKASKNTSGVIGVSEFNKSDKSITESILDDKQRKHRTIFYDDDLGNISVSQVVPNVISDAEKRRTIVFENDTGNISLTQEVASKFINKEKQRTVVYENENNDISITEAVPANVVLLNENNEKRKTIVFENEACDISMTQALPANVIISDNIKGRTIIMEDSTANLSTTQPVSNIIKTNTKETRRTVVYEDNTGNISVTHSVASSLNSDENVSLPDRRRTVVFESDIGNISVTQALPSNVIIPQKLNVTSYENDANISLTQAVPTNILLGNKNELNRRRTVVYEDDTGNLSITQVVPMSQIIQEVKYNQQRNTKPSDIVVVTNDVLHMKKCSDNNNRTIVFESNDEDNNISMTQAVNLNQILPDILNKQKEFSTGSLGETTGNRRRTIVFRNEDADISMTQAVNLNQVLLGQISEEKQNITYEDLDVATKTALHCYNRSAGERRLTVVYDDDQEDKAIKQTISKNITLSDEQKKKKAIIDMGLPIENKTLFNQLNEMTAGLKENESSLVLEKRDDLSMTKTSDTKVPKQRTIIFEHKHDISLAQRILDDFNSKLTQENTHSKALDDATTSLSKPIPTGLSAFQYETFDISHNKCNDIKEQNAMLMDLTTVEVGDILVYQTANASKQKVQEETEKDDSKKLNDIKFEDDKDATNIQINTLAGSGKTSSKNNMYKEKENEQSKITELELDGKVTCKDSTVVSGFEPKISILNDLLNMSHSSLVGEEDKGLMVKVSSEDRKCSADDMFFIINDSEENVQVDKSTETKTRESESKSSLLGIECKDDEEPVIIENIQKNLSELKSVFKGDHSPQGQRSTHVSLIGSNLESTESFNVSKRKSSKCFKKANDANELLEMISDFTEKGMSRNLEPTSEENEKAPTPYMKKENLSLENKENAKEPKRFSIIPKRKALTNEEILKNLSVAGEAIRRSRFEYDDSDYMNDTKDTPQSNLSYKKSARRSSEVVKTLHFEDDDSDCQKIESKQTNESPLKNKVDLVTQKSQSKQTNEAPLNKTVDSVSPKREIKQINELPLNNSADLISHESEPMQINETPLKKTAFGEVSYMKDSKSKVIPDFVDVTDNIKELMNDLVKPMADVLPFTTTKPEHGVKKTPSTCSTQIQTNLLNTSQIDLRSELYSNSESVFDGLTKFSPVNIINDAVNRSLSRAMAQSPGWSAAGLVQCQKSLKMHVKSDDDDTRATETSITKHSESSNLPQRVLIFDHNNPLNNVFIAPPLEINVHSYNPIQRTEVTADSGHSAEIVTRKMNEDFEMEQENITETDTKTDTSTSDRVTNQFQIQSLVTIPLTISENTDKCDTLSNSSFASKPMSFDQYTEPKINNQKDTEVNTVIAMKDNKELLETNSSLTLVDDALTHSKFALNIDAVQEKLEMAESPLQIIFKVDENQTEKKDSDLTSHNDTVKKTNQKKRMHSPKSRQDAHKHCTVSSLDITPKPACKMQKRSISPPTIQKQAVSPMKLIQAISPPTSQVRSISPTIQQAISHSVQQTASPTTKKAVSPMTQRAHSPTMQQAASPVIQRAHSPTTQQAVSPTLCQAVSPPMHRVASPLRQRTPSPTKQRVVSPLKPVVNLTTHQALSPTVHQTLNSTLLQSVNPSVQKFANTTNSDENPTRLIAEQDNNTVAKQKSHSKVEKLPRQFRNKTPGTNVTVQRLITMVHAGQAFHNDWTDKAQKEEDGIEMEDGSDTITEVKSEMSCEELEVVSSYNSSFTSSRYLKRDLSHILSTQKPLTESLPDTCFSEMSSKIAESDSEMDIISRIYSIPSMGSFNCDWESSKGDTWSFLFLHSRLRLTVRFATGERVRTNTPVLNVSLETLHQEKKNPIASLCVSFAAETMRHYMRRGCSSARDVARLVRQLAGAARLAARWARAMHDARARLAYCLSGDGRLALKVANTSVRTVWEVTMQLEAVVEDARSAPWPRACAVRVARVLAPAAGPARAPPALRRVLRDTPHDWGHVPRTVWKIFRFLKHRKREDEEMLTL